MPTKTFFNLPSEKRELIISAAIDEFSERNIMESKIALIMKRTKLSRGSFYTYFDSIEDLYLYTVTILRDKRFEYINDQWENEDLPFFEYFKELYIASVEFLLDNPYYIKIMKYLYATDHELCLELITSLQKKYYDRFLHRIEIDKENNIIKKCVNSKNLSNLFVQYSTVLFVFETRCVEVTLEHYEKNVENFLNILRSGVLCN